MAIKITKADESYAAVIASIGKRSFREAFECYFNKKEDLLKYLEYTYNSEKIEKSILKENNVYFIALADGIPVGFAKVKKFSLHPEIESGAQMELQKLYVLAEHHGSGAGPALMKAVLQLANELQPDYLWLDTLIINTKAIHFYERRGFKKTGKQTFRIGTQIFEYHLMSLPVAINELQHSQYQTS